MDTPNQDLIGQIWHVEPTDYKIAVYIRVGTGWWTKPYLASPLTNIECDGIWTCNITTGGSDALANTIKAFIVPVGYNPPLASGLTTLPAAIYENSIASVEVTRSP